MNLRGNWNYPTSVKAGSGRVSEVPALVRQLGLVRPLIVTDEGFAKNAVTTDLAARLSADGIVAGLYADVRSNPVGKNVLDGVAVYRAGKHDGVIALGGGSALDAAKAIALMSGQSRPLFDFEDVGDNWLRIDPLGIAPSLAIPTTAGTGSEVGRASVITDETAHVKKIIFHPKMLPSIVVLDPELTFGLPTKLTAATGMDALSHCLEAYCAPFYHPMAVGVALEGMRLVKENLPLVCREPTNADGRMNMLVASSMGATAFQRGLGAMHALAHPLGALFDAHHGMLNAVLMPYVLVANRAAVSDILAAAARYLNLPSQTFDGFLAFVVELRKEVGIPNTLAELGIDDSKAQLVGEMAVRDPSSGGNPIELTAEQYTALFLRALHGR